MGANDCGVVGASGVAGLIREIDVTFAPDSGVAYPEQTSAETLANWSASSTGGACSLISATHTADPNVYRLTFNRDLNFETVTITVENGREHAMVSNLGGDCVSPLGQVDAVIPDNDCGQISIAQPASTRRTLRVTFAAAHRGTASPDVTSAQTAANWDITTNVADGGGNPYFIAAMHAVKVSTYVYDVTVSRDLIPGEAVTVDTTAIATNTGGHC